MIQIDMDMPKSCEVCQFRFPRGSIEVEGPVIIHLCSVKLKAISNLRTREEWCPLIEVKDPIEEHKATKEVIKEYCTGHCDLCRSCILEDIK